MQSQNQLLAASINHIWKKLPTSITSSLNELKNLCYEFNDYLYSDRGYPTCEKLYARRFESMQKALKFLLKNNFKIEVISEFICDYYNTRFHFDYKEIAICHEFAGTISGDEIRQGQLYTIAAKYFEQALRNTSENSQQNILKARIKSAYHMAAIYYEFAAECYEHEKNNALVDSAMNSAAKCYDLAQQATLSLK